MELFHNLYNGFAVALTFQNILYCGFGVFFGQLIGVLPGIGAPTAIALLLPLTFTINPTSAIIMFAGIYYGVAYGGYDHLGPNQRARRILDGDDVPRRLSDGLAGSSRRCPVGGRHRLMDCGNRLHSPADGLCSGPSEIRPPLRAFRTFSPLR